VLRIALLFCALAVCAYANALWTAGHPQNVQDLGFGFPETFSPDEAQTEALRLALARWSGREIAREQGR